MAMVDRIADSDVGIIIRHAGESSRQRELHRRSTRRSKPFVKVNCAALPADLLEAAQRP
jgi:sigma-54 specific flagellar transcriptional regulator A